tara:strand:- start:192 stop:347 length:156 start_codon:yes stop_codon:yes gene_type:complete
LTGLNTLERIYVMSTVFDTVETLREEKRESEEDTLKELLELVENLSEVPEA